MGKKIDFSKFNNQWYHPGRGVIIRTLWFFINAIVFKSYLFPFNGLKIVILKIFGAEVGKSCVIKPNVNIKYPWHLKLGSFVWIGEEVWIDNLDKITIGSNVCISQGAFLLCGNHNYKLESFDLMVSPISIKDGAWIGAKSIVCPGAMVDENVVLSLGSVLKGKTEKFFIYSGNPAKAIKERIIE